MRETLIDPRERAGERSLLAGFAVFFSVLCTLLAGIGEWRTLNDQIGALPKLFSLGVIACAALCFMIKPDYEAAKKSLSVTAAGDSVDMSQEDGLTPGTWAVFLCATNGPNSMRAGRTVELRPGRNMVRFQID